MSKTKCVPLIIVVDDDVLLNGRFVEDTGWGDVIVRDNYKGVVIRLHTSGEVDFFCGANPIGNFEVDMYLRRPLSVEERLSIYKRLKQALKKYVKHHRLPERSQSIVFGDIDREPNGYLSLSEFGHAVADYKSPTYTNRNSGNEVNLFVINP